MDKRFQEFINAEIQKIKDDKWIEGEKIHRDPGVEYEIDWVDRYAENFRKAWNKSKCRDCIKCDECGKNTLSACDNYVEK